MLKLKKTITKLNNLILQHKSFVLVFIFVISLIILYNTNSNNLNTNSNNLNTNNNIKSKLQKVLKENEKFMDLTLKQLEKLSSTQTLPNPNITPNIYSEDQKKIITTYFDLFNETTKNEINNWLTDNDNTDSVDTNLNNMINNYNNFQKNIQTILEETNYDLLRQLQKNYAIAHKVNLKRQIDIENIDNLPQRFD